MQKTKVKFLDRPYLPWTVISLITYLIVEGINQRGLTGLLRFILSSPYAFLINLGIVMLTYSAALFIKRRLFNYSLVAILWALVAGINLVLILQRNTQFNCSDILIFRYGIFITTRYLSILHCILIAIGVTVATVSVIYLYRHGYRSDNSHSKKRSGILLGAMLVCIVVMSVIGNLTGIMMPRFTDIAKGYEKNGFVYAFGCSVLETGVTEPEQYTEDSVQGITSKLPEENAATDERPNVIFVQLESFIDPDEIKDLEFEEDPVPNFNRLIEEYPSGHLEVSVVGGGTANTEFEILTGMNLKYFGTIEYPYETYADNETCESMPYNYRALGYKSHAIHNFSAGFYMRNNVFRNLGFDTFTSFEYMTDIEYNGIGWAKDAILERYIMSALGSTEERDFVYAISVQGHGSYPTEFDDSQSDVETTFSSQDIEDYRPQIDYYVSQVKEMDSFVGSLTDTLSQYSEPTVVVFYGDHLPGIALSGNMMETGTLYKTEYVIWSNFDIEAEDRDLCTYQLAAYVQDKLGFSSGQLTKFHQTFGTTDEYEEYLQILEYDIIEGEMLTYGGTNPFQAPDMTFGVEKITVTEAQVMDKTLYVAGVNFNEHSAVYINGHHKNTEYLNSTSLMVNGVDLKDGDIITVAQMSYQMPWTYLSQSEEYVYEEDTDIH